MEKGIVKWFDPKKNYGFITTANGDLWFHGSAVKGDAVTQNDKVTFNIQQHDKGPRAIDIEKEI